MKKNLYISIITLAVFATVTISCSDDFVSRPVQYSIDSENYFNSKSDYDNALIAAYDMLQSSFINVLMGEIASDNTFAGGNSPTDVIGYQQIDQMTHGPVNENLKQLWDWMFAGVQRANYILEFKDKTDFQGKNQVIAEARFLRAYYQFELVKWFGGIPMKGDARFAPGDEKSIPRSSVSEVYASIQNDLIFAAANLSAIPAQKGRATSGAALALLGKAYLYDKKYDKAAETFDKLITTGNYRLVKTTDLTPQQISSGLSAFGSIFEDAGENGPESVFEVQYTDVEGASYGALQASEGNVAVGFAGPFGYVGPTFADGNNFNLPTPKIVSAFEAGDSRKAVTILDMVAWIAQNPGTSYTKQNQDTGYFNRKYIPRTRRPEAAGDVKLTSPNNYRAIRYADVLLMAAEAHNKSTTSNDGRARTYLNEVRARAFGDNNHNITASGAALADFIQAERRVELAGEGFRFFDLVRTGKAVQEIPNFKANKNELFPLPIEEIQFANGNWAQNPGY
ncbi:RagB/SusD family nutrient uptake outer membrane protein [Flavobacterium sp.]|uniref:RagB/SusD family nutrient uptake outer membrane protein n=1 Tax=Flavobacterium sp. TaxID=239 RepID=UPI002603A986|nr:RagB/SusD family nutrient uptake outer membrane protein [Flavobacterium sp.]MDG2433812.1 RagB/SusD family nutrient uptake outer membrane protein [Flavobacterium sp.]